MQLRDIKPRLDDAQVRLIAVGIGTPERGVEFCDHIGFPRESLYSDPQNVCYDALGLYKSASRTFFNQATPYAILSRLQTDGAKDLKEALSRWKPWIPPDLSQGLQQGGMFVFGGKEVLFEHFDQATGDHADLDVVLKMAGASP